METSCEMHSLRDSKQRTQAESLCHASVNPWRHALKSDSAFRLRRQTRKCQYMMMSDKNAKLPKINTPQMVAIKIWLSKLWRVNMFSLLFKNLNDILQIWQIIQGLLSIRIAFFYFSFLFFQDILSALLFVLHYLHIKWGYQLGFSPQKSGVGLTCLD